MSAIQTAVDWVRQGPMRGPIIARGVAAGAKVSHATACRALERLVVEGALVRVGRKRGLRYYAPDSPPDASAPLTRVVAFAAPDSLFRDVRAATRGTWAAWVREALEQGVGGFLDYDPDEPTRRVCLRLDTAAFERLQRGGRMSARLRGALASVR